jgi:hypothetical protein
VYFVTEVGVFFLSEGNRMAGLTDTEIKRAKAAEKAYSMGDGGGLYRWVKPTGGKLWRWSYRFDGKEKLMSLKLRPAGSGPTCPATLCPAQCDLGRSPHPFVEGPSPA